MPIISVEMNVVKHSLRSKLYRWKKYLRCCRGSTFTSNCHKLSVTVAQAFHVVMSESVDKIWL